MLTLIKTFNFCAAHRYWVDAWPAEDNVRVFGEDHRIHGHNYTLEVHISGRVDAETGYLMDLGELKSIVNERVIAQLDHSQIEEDIPWFKARQPSVENLTFFIWETLEPVLPPDIQLVKVRVIETPTISAEFDGRADQDSPAG